MPLVEDYYESGNAPHEALGRAARKLAYGGALYLGAGVGVEKQKTKADGGGESYALTRSTGKQETFSGPLSAAMRAFALAGSSTAGDSPGGSTKVSDPAAAARLRELVDDERRCVRDIARYESRVKARAANPTVYSPGTASDDSWEVRQLAELRKELSQIKAERAALTKTGKVEEAESGKPGTNWTQVSPAARKKIDPIVKHYRGMAHPFTACVADNTKRFGPERAKKVCAVVKDMAEGTTKWRKGGKGKVSEHEAGALLAGVVSEAEARLAAFDEAFGAGATIELAERADELGEVCFSTLAEMFVGGHPLGVLWQQLREEQAMAKPVVGFRKRGEGYAMADGSFAIETVDDVHTALRAGGAVPPDTQDAVKGHIRARAASLGVRMGEADLDEAFSSGQQGSANPAVKTALARGGKKAPNAPRTAPGSYDNSKHPRGAKGTRSGGKFVSKGSGGTAVRTVQHRLGIATDGNYGPKTTEAVRNYQRQHGLQVDGVVGRQTLAALSGNKNAKAVKPGSLSSADHRELHRIRRAQVRRRAHTPPHRGRGGMIV